MSDPVTRLNAALEGRYAIERELGEGGMATVYLAEDLKHQRKVALKVLKPELAAVVGAERFLAEIKVTANLQHPNILPLHDSGEADSFLFYVMPYVEGDTLKDRLAREGPLPVNDAVAIAKDIAEALQAAHEQGVIHRDIKPGNVLISRGKPLISDFGIALALSSAGAGERLTETGLSLGTPYYMSPEQATGDQAVGASTDTYALGCVLYEMLVGEPPYAGSSAQAVLGRIIAGKHISATEERPSVPANVDGAIRKALEKLPADRFASAQEFAKALADEHFRYGELATADAGAGAGPWKRLSMGLAGIAALLVATVLVLTSGLFDQPAPEVVRFSVTLGQDVDLYLGPTNGARPIPTSLAFSPDGDRLVYSGFVPGQSRRLYEQRLDQERAVAIEGTEGASFPFFSPDGAWIGFNAGRAQRRLSMADGHIETIAEGASMEGATWGDDGTIVLVSDFDLYQVPATGGEPELLIQPNDFPRFAQPDMLPGSKVVLFHAWRSVDPAHAEIVALDLGTREQKTLLTDAMNPRYVQTGHLLFMRQGTLMAVGFDPERVEVLGQPVIMVEDVMHSVFTQSSFRETGAAQVAVSASGHLAYALGGVKPEIPTTAVRVTSAGDTIPLEMDERGYGGFRLSPDGSSLASTVRHGQQTSIWVHDLSRGVAQRLNTGGFSNWPMEWSPDGREIAFSSDRDQWAENIYRVPVDGSAEPERLAPSDRRQLIMSWSSQGVIAWLGADIGRDIWVLPPDGDPAPFFTSEFIEEFATFSPDGQWLSYVSNRNGPRAVYVRPYPGPEPATLIASGGATSPVWSPDGRQIYYWQAGVLWAVDLTPGDEFQVGLPVALMDPWPFRTFPTRAYDVFSDGSFVNWVRNDDGRSELEQFGATELHVVLNWAEELKERVSN